MDALFRNPMMPEIKIYGVRHLSPACSKALRQELACFRPDILLLEAPSDMEKALWAALPPARPPLALVSYTESRPARSVLMPLSVYSPEYTALCYAAENVVPLRCIDMPSFFFAERQNEHFSALSAFARYALKRGERSFEDAWERQFEHCQDFSFTETLQFGRELRDYVAPDEFTRLREAHMRMRIGEAEDESFSKIAVVCGAYHAPFLSEEGIPLPALTPEPMRCSIIPYSYRLLAARSGYGAGNAAPRYFERLHRIGTMAAQAEFLTETAVLCRERGLSVSTAEIQDAVLLARSLGRFRGGSAVHHDLCDAARTCFIRTAEDSAHLEDALEQVGIGDCLGETSGADYTAPLTDDFRAAIKELRLTPGDRITLRLNTRSEETIDDLRSRFFHRLRVMDLPCAVLLPTPAGASAQREDWRFQPDAESYHMLVLSEGLTLFEAAAKHLEARSLTRLRDATRYIEDLLLCQLPALLPRAVQKLDALPPSSESLEEPLRALVFIGRYLSDYRPHPFDKETLSAVYRRLAHRCRAALSVPADTPTDEIRKLAPSLPVLHRTLSHGLPEAWRDWCTMLRDTAHPLIAGCMTGFLLETDRDMNALKTRMSAVFSAHPPDWGRDWTEGFLSSGRKTLFYDKTFLSCLAEVWAGLPEASAARFSLRRALARLTSEERAALPFASLLPPEDATAFLYPDSAETNSIFKTAADAARWLQEARRDFTAPEFFSIQQDALQNPAFLRHVAHPAVLEHLSPQGTAAARILERPIPPKSLPAVRKLLTGWVEDALPSLQAALAHDPRISSSRTQQKGRLNLRRIVRHNIRLYDKAEESLLPARLFFAPPPAFRPLPNLYFLLDRSGSMMEHSLWGALVGCALTRIPFLKTRLFAFAEETEELMMDSGPLDVLLSLPYGGGTNLTDALRYVGQEIPAPARSHLLLVTDLLCSGSRRELLEGFEALLQEKLQITLVFSLTGNRPDYDTALAAELGQKGVRCLSLPISDNLDFPEKLFG